MRDLLARFGVESDVVDVRDPKALAPHIRSNTRLLLIESPANPTVDIVDIQALAATAEATPSFTTGPSDEPTAYARS